MRRLPYENLTMKPLCIDLFCGYGGWARGFLDAGYLVVGFDNEPKCAKRYPGEFVLADVRTLDGTRFCNATVIVASPPCQEFSDLRFLRKDPPEPDMELVNAVWRIRDESGVSTIIENVRGARRFWPQEVKAHRGPFYLWGDLPPIFGTMPPYKKVGAIARARAPDGTLKASRLRQWGARPRGESSARERSMIPYPLARALANACLP